MTNQLPSDGKTAENDLERILIYHSLASEYLALIDAAGDLSEPGDHSLPAARNHPALSLRLMLERKFVYKNDKNTYIPKVINSLKRHIAGNQEHAMLDRHRADFEGIMSGKLAGVSANFNNVELTVDKIRLIFSYGRLMHSDRNKHVGADVLSNSFTYLLIRQSKLLAETIEAIRDYISTNIESGRIPHVSDTMKQTWLDMHDDPAAFDLGERLSTNEIPALSDDGSQPLPGGPRKRTVVVRIPELGDGLRQKPPETG